MKKAKAGGAVFSEEAADSSKQPVAERAGGDAARRGAWSYDTRGLPTVVHSLYNEGATYQDDALGRVTTMTRGNGAIAETSPSPPRRRPSSTAASAPRGE